jgi:hypothetical protein
VVEKDDSALDYNAVLDDLRSKRAELDAAIAAIERITGAAPTGGHGDAPVQGRGSAEATLRTDAFFNMSILDATQKYLNYMKKPQSLMSVAKALEEHGMIHTSKAWPATVFTTLRRAEERGDRVLRVSKNWALAEWYPNRPKKADAKPAKKKQAKKAKAKVAAPAAAQPSPSTTAAA